MNASLWAAAVAVAVTVGAAGAEKLITPYATLRARRAWVHHLTPGELSLIGTLEVFGAIGLIAPAVAGIAPALVPIAGWSIAALMVIAIYLESGDQRHPAAFLLPVVTMLLAVTVALGRSASLVR